MEMKINVLDINLRKLHASTTTTTTTTTSHNPGGTMTVQSAKSKGVIFDILELLYEADGHRYFKVLVPHGVKLLAGSVPDTCQANGLEAVCFGSSGCSHNLESCLVTPLKPLSCGSGVVDTISKLICNGSVAPQCPKTNNMFIYIANWGGNSACGNVDGIHCV